jgi:hypothetical protein
MKKTLIVVLFLTYSFSIDLSNSIYQTGTYSASSTTTYSLPKESSIVSSNCLF